VSRQPRIDIRRLSPAEAPLYRAIRLEALQRDPDAFGSTFAEESAHPLTVFAERLERSAVFGAFCGGDLQGTAGFFVQPGAKHAHKGMLVGMYVGPAARGAGIGRRLVEAVIDYARGQVELIQLRVISDNDVARRLYARLGFEEYGVEKCAAKHEGRYHDDVLMAKMLLPQETSR
jgi:RimJ/RimL family protein N-acetyltransferase